MFYYIDNRNNLNCVFYNNLPPTLSFKCNCAHACVLLLYSNCVIHMSYI